MENNIIEVLCPEVMERLKQYREQVKIIVEAEKKINELFPEGVFSLSIDKFNLNIEVDGGK